MLNVCEKKNFNINTFLLYFVFCFNKKSDKRECFLYFFLQRYINVIFVFFILILARRKKGLCAIIGKYLTACRR